MTDSRTLLAEYAKTGSDSAFRELVARYLNLVYSAAVRLVNGDRHLAEDVSQTVFLDLARLSGALAPDVMLGGWLHRHTCYVAAKTMRGERRRKSRERQAAEMNALQDPSHASLAEAGSILDEAINRLGAAERNAILLRFFEQRDLRSVGEALGTTEEAARKRVHRALEKLQNILKRRGVAFSTATLGSALTAEAVAAAPAGLAATISTAAVSGAAAAGTSVTVFKLLAMTSLKNASIGAIVIASVAAPLAIHHQSHARVADSDTLLREQAARLTALQSEHDRLSALAIDNPLAAEQLADLKRLRVEAESLRNQAVDLAALREENERLRKARREAVVRARTPLQAQEERIARLNFSKQWLLAFVLFAGDNRDRLPATFDEARAFFKDNDAPESEVPTDQFEIVYHGSLTAITNPMHTILLREKEASPTPDGQWTKVYGFADGHAEARTQAEPDFEEWERARIIQPQ